MIGRPTSRAQLVERDARRTGWPAGSRAHCSLNATRSEHVLARELLGHEGDGVRVRRRPSIDDEGHARLARQRTRSASSVMKFRDSRMSPSRAPLVRCCASACSSCRPMTPSLIRICPSTSPRPQVVSTPGRLGSEADSGLSCPTGSLSTLRLQPGAPRSGAS